MNWVESISNAIEYIEKNITEDLTIEDIARHAYVSPFYFQKGFAMLCGFTVGEYIRNRRLSLAANDLLTTNERIIDIAVKYGYDSPDSFTKAFVRFNGSTPTQVRKGGQISYFAPFKLNLTMKGGYIMEYRLEEKESFRVIGLKKQIKYEAAGLEIPKIWTTFFKKYPLGKVKPKYAVNFDDTMGNNTFTYMICDDYKEDFTVPKGLEVMEIPKFTWAIFTCIGPTKIKMPEINEKIFTEWLPNSSSYDIAAGYNIEMYANPKDYKKGTDDEEYYCEIWIPVRKKGTL